MASVWAGVNAYACSNERIEVWKLSCIEKIILTLFQNRLLHGQEKP
jgi:hypothetical protein